MANLALAELAAFFLAVFLLHFCLLHLDAFQGLSPFMKIKYSYSNTICPVFPVGSCRIGSCRIMQDRICTGYDPPGAQDILDEVRSLAVDSKSAMMAPMPL